jgi:hypothetical protein
MKIKETLQTLLNYYERTRGVGHTRVMLEGATNRPEALVVFAYPLQDKILTPGPLKNSQVLSLETVTTDLLGRGVPLVFDNTGMSELLAQSLEEINRLEAEVQSLQDKTLTNYSRPEGCPSPPSTESTSTPQGEQKQKPLFSTLSIEAKPLDGSPSIPLWNDLNFKIDGNDWSPLIQGLVLEFLPGEPIVANMRLVVSELNLENMPVEVRAQFEKWIASQKLNPAPRTQETEPTAKPVGLQDYALWEPARVAIREGKVSYGHSCTSHPSHYVIELKDAGGEIVYGWLWFRQETGNVISISHCYVIEQVRRCGALTRLHEKLLEWFPETRMIVTARATEMSLPWLVKAGFVFNEEFSRWEYSVPQKQTESEST